MNIKKYIVSGCVALMSLGVTSCIGDLDLQPNDPNLVDTDSPDFKDNILGMCYSGLACSGISGPGSSYISGMDAGASAYLRLIFTCSEYPSDEMVWIWPNDEGGTLGDLLACTWSNNNPFLNGIYYRLLGHITICNQYLLNTMDDNDAETIEHRAEARVLRAYSYYNMCDLFGQSSFITEEFEAGAAPIQISRLELYNWLESELVDVVDNRLIDEKPLYGRVGLDAAEALLAKLYLNAEVFSGTQQWAKCAERCENIIARHTGTGFRGTGLAEHYLYLFQRDNASYMPGGDKPGENEILFGIAFDDTYTQSYGGPTFIISGTVADTHYVPQEIYGTSSQWACIRGIQQMADRFDGGDNKDVRDDLWVRGEKPAGKAEYASKTGGEPLKEEWEAEDYSNEFKGFSGDWKTTGGNAIIKFTGRTRNAAQDGGWDMEYVESPDYVGYYSWNCKFPATTYASTDQPVIRLADIYLMYAECHLNSGRSVGNAQTALQYVNNVRARAGATEWNSGQLTIQNLMDERSRELYLESWRRNDLVRNGMFAGPQQTVWQVKGNLNNMQGTRIATHFNLFPIPFNVLSTQPDFKQNPGY